MSNTVLSFGGTALSTFGKVTRVDDYLSAPSRRGSDITVPFQEGDVFVKKFYGSRTVTVYMSIISASEQAMETSLDLLNTYVAIPTEQTLSMTMAGSAVRNIQASVNRKPDVRIEHNASNSALARVALEFVCTKPFWRSGTQLTSTTTIDASPKAITLNNTGGAPERQPNIVITGPFTSMTIANSTTSTSMTYAGSIGGSETVTIGVNTTGEWTAVYSVGTANVIGNITHTGDSTFMAFNPGNNSLSVTSAGGDNTGTLNFNFYPPYL